MARALLIPMYREAQERGEVHFCAYTPSQLRAKELAKQMGGHHLENLENFSLLQGQDYYFICCKPQQFDELAQKIRGQLNPDGVVVSLLAGTTLQALSQGLEHRRIVRLMPNTPAMVGAGITLFLASTEVGEEKQKPLLKSLKKAGKVFSVRDEDQLDRVMGYTGSGPAYFFELTRLLAEDLKSFGVSSQEAQDLMIELVWGAAKMMKESNQSPEQLRVNVTSKGGVTFEALEVLRREGLETLFRQALEANYQRAKVLAQKPQKN